MIDGNFLTGMSSALEAMVESSGIVMTGLQSMGRDAAEWAQRSFEAGTHAAAQLAQADGAGEWLRLSGDHWRAGMDALVGQAARTTEAGLKLAGEAAAPIQNHIAAAAARAAGGN